jgi:hypothetical protein
VDLAKSFDTVWVKGLLYKLTVLNLLSYLVKNISLHLDCRRSKRPSSQPHPHVACGMEWPWDNSSPLCCLFYVNDIPTPSHRVELANYADEKALVGTSRSSSLVFFYLEAYLRRLERWLRDWRIAINVSKIIAVLFVNATRRIQNPRAVQFL